MPVGTWLVVVAIIVALSRRQGNMFRLTRGGHVGDNFVVNTSPSLGFFMKVLAHVAFCR